MSEEASTATVDEGSIEAAGEALESRKGRRGKRPDEGVRVPHYDLNDSIEVARKLHDELGGAGSVTELAAKLGYSGTNNGAFITRLASARQFGLITGRGSELGLSDTAQAILMPETPEIELDARARAWESVPLFKAFYDAFDGRALPARDGRLNALRVRFNVPADRAVYTLDRLEKGAEQAGYFRVSSDRMIRPRAVTSAGGVTTERDARPEERPKTESERAAQHMLIRGALAELPPPGERWDEAGLRQWLDLVELAARVIYKLPKNGGRD